MDVLPLSPETAAELEDLARRQGKDPVELGGAGLAIWIAQEREDFEEACRGIERGDEDFRAGRSRPARDVLADLRRKYDIPG